MNSEIRMDFKPGERFHPDVDDLISICHKAFLSDVHGIILTHRAHGDLCVMINFIHNDDDYWQWGWNSSSAVYLTEQKYLLRVVDSWIRNECIWRKGEWWFK